MQMLNKICVGKEWRKGGKEEREGELERRQKELKREDRQSKKRRKKWGGRAKDGKNDVGFPSVC